jgi:hypothetical protein
MTEKMYSEILCGKRSRVILPGEYYHVLAVKK